MVGKLMLDSISMILYDSFSFKFQKEIIILDKLKCCMYTNRLVTFKIFMVFWTGNASKTCKIVEHFDFVVFIYEMGKKQIIIKTLVTCITMELKIIFEVSEYKIVFLIFLLFFFSVLCLFNWQYKCTIFNISAQLSSQ